MHILHLKYCTRYTTECSEDLYIRLLPERQLDALLMHIVTSLFSARPNHPLLCQIITPINPNILQLRKVMEM